MKQTTKTVPTRMGLQSLWGAVERLSLTLIFVMLTTAAWADLNAFRAYFLLADPNGKAREFVVNFDGGSEETGIISLSKEPRSQGEADAWYTVNGVKLDKEPTKPGLYIYKGKKVKH